MARESCNLDKEEAEILKPSSSPSSQPPSSSSSSSSSPSPPSPPSPPPPSSASSPPLFLKPPQEFSPQSPQTPETPAAITPAKEPSPAVQLGNRCSSCRKRVGLTAFRCRCGDLFCDRHRYSDTHDCSFDYKAAAREQISKANPVIRAAKIIKI